MKTQHLLYILTVGVGVIIGLLLSPEHNPEQPYETQTKQSVTTDIATNTTPTDLGLLKEIQQDIVKLKLALEAESKARELLKIQVAQLNSDDAIETDDTLRKNKVIKTSARPTVNSGNDGWINADLLISAGMNQLDVKRITGIFERSEMEKLYLRDRAVREGWTGTNRFREEMSKLRKPTDNLREELTERDYDAYLFATGKPNRVIVKSALSNSPASSAGILPGDTIYKYNNIRVYTWADLRQETAKGSVDELVPVQVLRNNRKIEFFIKRGPLGIRLDHLSLTPAG